MGKQMRVLMDKQHYEGVYWQVFLLLKEMRFFLGCL